MNAPDVLGLHLPVEDGFGCAGCGWLPKSMAATDDAEFGSHQFDALKAAGYAVVLVDDIELAAQVLDLYLADRFDGDLPGVEAVYERFVAADAAEAQS